MTTPVETHAHLIRGCSDAIALVPVTHFALLLVTTEHVEVRACPHEQLADLLTGCVGDPEVAHLVAKRDSVVVKPGYREHFIVVLELHTVDAPWEPPNVTTVGASIAALTRGPRGEA